MKPCCVVVVLCTLAVRAAAQSYVTVLGDPGMRNAQPSVGYEGWNFCNGALAPAEYNQSVSPRMADCVMGGGGPGPFGNTITDADNALGPGIPFPGGAFPLTSDVNLYAREKELYFGSLCAAPSPDGRFNSSMWMVMMKSGNMNTGVGVCPKTNFTPEAVPVSACVDAFQPSVTS